MNKKQQELNKMLNEWDPIGILPYKGGPQDEYDCFIGPILTLLESNKDKEELVNFLKHHLEEHIGLPTELNKLDLMAEKIIKWWKA